MVNMEETEVIKVNGEIPNRKLDKTILDSFSKLVNPHEHVRVKSAASLLRYLVENDKNDEGLNESKYALKRLVRGLGAPTFTARAGYYSTLVGLLSLQLDISPSELLALVKSELHKSGKNSDAENADISTGQILAFGAIVRTGLWASIDSEQKEECLKLVLAASKERTYLGLFGYSFIIDLVNRVPDIKKDPVFLKNMQEEVLKPWTAQTLDTLYLLLSLKLACPKSFSKKAVAKCLGTADIICEESVEPLCNILMTIPRVTSLKHPVFEVIVKLLTSDVLPSFFNELDKHLKTPNRNRLLVFIKILTSTLPNIEFLDQTADLFTRNFITQLLGYFRTFKGNQKDKEYQDAVQKMFQTLIESCQQEHAKSSVKIAVIKKFLFDAGTFVFEKVTKSKVVQQITQTLDSDGVKELGMVYKGVVDGSERISSENESETWLNNDRLYSAHLFIKLLNMPAMKQESDWKVEQLTFLLDISLLTEINGMNVGRELAESLKIAFYGSLDLKLSKLEELHTILRKLAQHLDEKISPDNLDTVLRTPISVEAYELWQRAIQTVDKIEKKQKKGGIKTVFLTMFLHMGLQLFNDVQLATDSLNELFSCYDRVKKDKKAKPIAECDELESDPYWTEVVVDLFLNLLSHSSHLLRSIISSVFPHLCPYMNSTTIHQIVSVMDPTNDENPLSKIVDSGSESEEEEEGSEQSEEEEGSESEESKSDSDSERDEDETAADRLRMALQQVLTQDADNESVDLDEMSDSEGERLDKALADAFRQFRPNRGRRKKQTKDQETLTHFRIRVLDLVEIYLNSSPSMLLTLEIMLPLLQAVEFSIRDEHQKPLNDRLRSVLKKLLGLRKFSHTEGVDHTILVDLLKSLLDKGSKNALIVQEMGEQISHCCIFVVRCAEIVSTTTKVAKRLKAAILEVVSGELHQFLTKRDCLTPYVLFKDIMQLSWAGNIGLAIILLDFIFSPDVRQFQKNHVAELLKLFYSNQRFFSRFKAKAEGKMAEAHQQFSSGVVQFFKGLCEDPENRNVKERFICNMFNLLAAMKQSCLDLSGVAWPEIAEQIREYRSYKSFSKDAKMAFNKLCRLLGVSNVVAMKQHVTKLPTLINDEALGEVKEGQKKKRKRKSNETLKLKKEAKKLRLESLSKGLENATSVPMEEDVEEDLLPEIARDVDGKKTKADEEVHILNGTTQVNGFDSPKKIKKSKRHSIAVGSVNSGRKLDKTLPNSSKKKRKISV